MSGAVSPIRPDRQLALVKASKPAKSAAQLIEEANAAQAHAERVAKRALGAILPAALRLEADLAAFATLSCAKVGPRERARTLALHIARETAAIAAMQGSRP